MMSAKPASVVFFTILALKAVAILDVAMLCAVEVRKTKPGNHLNCSHGSCFTPDRKQSNDSRYSICASTK